MNFLLGFEIVEAMLPLIIMPIIFMFVFVLVIVLAVKKANSNKRQRTISERQTVYTDGNGRTARQNEYLNAKRRELAERKIISGDGSHSHSGKVEKYDKIVGSLGEVDDEGCDELDGVRLIEHDESYCDDPDHILTSDYTDLEKAIVLGEIINSPRFKQPFGRK